MKTKMIALKDRIKTIWAVAMLTLTFAPMGTFALDTDAATWSESATDIDTLLGSIIGLVLGLAQGIGAVILVLGIFKVISSLKDSNANEQSQGIQLALVGVFMLGLRTLLKAANLID